jgi:hypothetical protein
VAGATALAPETAVGTCVVPVPTGPPPLTTVDKFAFDVSLLAKGVTAWYELLLSAFTLIPGVTAGDGNTALGVAALDDEWELLPLVRPGGRGVLEVTPAGGGSIGDPDVGVRLPGGNNGPGIGGPDVGGPDGGPSKGVLTAGGMKPGGRIAVPTVGGAPGGPMGLGES